MTLEELAIRVGRSENTLKKNFLRTQKTLAKKGIFIKRDYDEFDKPVYSIEYAEVKKES
jgi:hypothetical protein